MKRVLLLCVLLAMSAGILSGCNRALYTITERVPVPSGLSIVVEVPANTSEAELRRWGNEISSAESKGTGSTQVSFFRAGNKDAPPMAIYADGMLMMIKK